MSSDMIGIIAISYGLLVLGLGLGSTSITDTYSHSILVQLVYNVNRTMND